MCFIDSTPTATPVPVDPVKALHGVRIGVDVDRRPHDDVESTHLVEPEDVVGVLMSEGDGMHDAQLGS